MMNQTNCIHLIGLGMDFNDLPPSYLQLLEQADLLAGGIRLLQTFEYLQAEQIAVSSPVEESINQIEEARKLGKQVVVLADGDPLYFGIGQRLLRTLGSDKLRVYPNVTALQTAASRLKLPWSEIRTVSLHGRKDLHPLLEVLSKHHLAGVFTDPNNTPGTIADVLMDKDRNNFLLHICEDLCTQNERIHSLSPEAVQASNFSDLNFVIVERLAPPRVEPGLGLEDTNYIHENGMITKKEIRVQGLSELNVQKGDTIWDLGAGSGSVAIEASWISGNGRVYAVEKDPERISRIRQNVTNTCRYCVHPIQGEISACLDELPEPDRIFIGGGAGRDTSILDISLKRIRSGGKIVLHFVLIKSLSNALEFCRENGLDHHVTHVQISRSSDLKGDIRFSPLNPVYVLTILVHR